MCDRQNMWGDRLFRVVIFDTNMKWRPFSNTSHLTNWTTNDVSLTELWVETAEERRHMDRRREHQRNQLVPPAEGELCQKKARRSKSSCYNQVCNHIQYNHHNTLDHLIGFKTKLITFYYLSSVSEAFLSLQNGIIWIGHVCDWMLFCFCQWGAEAGLWEGRFFPRAPVCGPGEWGAQHPCSASSCRLVSGEAGGLSAGPSHGPKCAWQSLAGLGTMDVIAFHNSLLDSRTDFGKCVGKGNWGTLFKKNILVRSNVLYFVPVKDTFWNMKRIWQYQHIIGHFHNISKRLCRKCDVIWE